MFLAQATRIFPHLVVYVFVFKHKRFTVKVEFGNNEKYPHCECIDWCTTMLPCKHFVAVMRDIKDWSWSKFPESYRYSPYLTLDEIVNPKPPEDHENKADGSTENAEGTESCG